MSLFIPLLSGITAPLRDLLKNEYLWTEKHEEIFKKLKGYYKLKPPFHIMMRINLPLLVHHPEFEAVLLQDSLPIEFASSRQPAINSTNIELDLQIAHVQLHDERLKSLQQATSDDEILQRTLIMEGWPTTRRQLHKSLYPYWSFRDHGRLRDHGSESTHSAYPKK